MKSKESCHRYYLMDSTQRMASMKMRAHTEWTTDEVEKTNIFSFWMIHNMKPSIEKETNRIKCNHYFQKGCEWLDLYDSGGQPFTFFFSSNSQIPPEIFFSH